MGVLKEEKGEEPSQYRTSRQVWGFKTKVEDSIMKDHPGQRRTSHGKKKGNTCGTNKDVHFLAPPSEKRSAEKPSSGGTHHMKKSLLCHGTEEGGPKNRS